MNRTPARYWQLVVLSSVLFWMVLAGVTPRAPVEAQSTPEPPRLLLRAGAFDPLAQEPSVPDRLRRQTQSLDGPALHLIQFPGPIQDAWHRALRNAGLELVTYVPEYGYLVWGRERAVRNLRAAAPLCWSGTYHPYYALHPALIGPYPPTVRLDVTVQLYDHPGVERALTQIKQRAVAVIASPHRVLVYRNLGVRIAAADVSWLAALPVGVLFRHILFPVICSVASSFTSSHRTPQSRSGRCRHTSSRDRPRR